MSDTEKQVLQRQAYSAATTKLREAYREQFEGFLADEYAARGLEYRPRLSGEAKAKAQIDALLAEYPHLASDYGRPVEARLSAPVPAFTEPAVEGLAVQPIAEGKAAVLRGGRLAK